MFKKENVITLSATDRSKSVFDGFSFCVSRHCFLSHLRLPSLPLSIGSLDLNAVITFFMHH